MLGREHSDDHGVMAATLGTGLRALPGSHADHQTPDHQTLDHQTLDHQTLDHQTLDDQTLFHPTLFHPTPDHQTTRHQTLFHQTTDILFARLDDDVTARTAVVFGEDDREEEHDSDEAEDGLDLWSVLYGLE